MGIENMLLSKSSSPSFFSSLFSSSSSSLSFSSYFLFSFYSFTFFPFSFSNSSSSSSSFKPHQICQSFIKNFFIFLILVEITAANFPPSSSSSSSSPPFAYSFSSPSASSFSSSSSFPSASSTATFRSSNGFLVFKWRIYSTFQIIFHIRTFEPACLLLLASSKQGQGDYFAVELFEGRLRCLFDAGGGAVVAEYQSPSLADGRWHMIGVKRHQLSLLILSVDQVQQLFLWQNGQEVIKTEGQNLPKSHSNFLNLSPDNDVFVAGIDPKLRLTADKKLKDILKSSYKGFHGCLSNVSFDNFTYHLVDNPANNGRSTRVISSVILRGCTEPSQSCQKREKITSIIEREACSNGGECIQEWGNHFCDCSLTSFTGPQCRKEGIEYEFEELGSGIITYRFPNGDWPDSREDKVAFALETHQSSASLFKMQSGSGMDFVELFLKSGRINALYNVGHGNHLVSDESDVRGRGYVVVKFIRKGADSTLQVGDGPVRSFKSPGDSLTVFNHISIIRVGGRKASSSKKLKMAFTGRIRGINVNGLDLFKMASANHPRMQVKGAVKLIVNKNNGSKNENELSTYESNIKDKPRLSNHEENSGFSENYGKNVNINETIISKTNHATKALEKNYSLYNKTKTEISLSGNNQIKVSISKSPKSIIFSMDGDEKKENDLNIKEEKDLSNIDSTNSYHNKSYFPDKYSENTKRIPKIDGNIVPTLIYNTTKDNKHGSVKHERILKNYKNKTTISKAVLQHNTTTTAASIHSPWSFKQITSYIPTWALILSIIIITTILLLMVIIVIVVLKRKSGGRYQGSYKVDHVNRGYKSCSGNGGGCCDRTSCGSCVGSCEEKNNREVSGKTYVPQQTQQLFQYTDVDAITSVDTRNNNFSSFNLHQQQIASGQEYQLKTLKFGWSCCKKNGLAADMLSNHSKTLGHASKYSCCESNCSKNLKASNSKTIRSSLKTPGKLNIVIPPNKNLCEACYCSDKTTTTSGHSQSTILSTTEVSKSKPLPPPPPPLTHFNQTLKIHSVPSSLKKSKNSSQSSSSNYCNNDLNDEYLYKSSTTRNRDLKCEISVESNNASPASLSAKNKKGDYKLSGKDYKKLLKLGKDKSKREWYV